jgi:hypothetical protein
MIFINPQLIAAPGPITPSTTADTSNYHSTITRSPVDSVSEALTSKDQSSFDNSACPQVDPKIVLPSQISCQEISSTHKCPYCDIQGYGMRFGNLDLLERHVVQRHIGWTAYPGQEKYKQEQRQRANY